MSNFHNETERKAWVNGEPKNKDRIAALCPATMGCPPRVNPDHSGDSPITFRGVDGTRFHFGTVHRVAEHAAPVQKPRK